MPERDGGWLGEGDERGLVCRADGQRTTADTPKEQLSFKVTGASKHWEGHAKFKRKKKTIGKSDT